MKKLSALLATFVLFLALLTACSPAGKAEQGGGSTSGNAGQNSDSPSGAFDPSQVKTMGDVFAYAGEGNNQEAFSEEKYVYVLDIDGTYYRATADMPKDVSNEVWAVEFDDEDRDQKIRDLIAPLEVSSFENLSEQIPPQEELDKLVGKTGQELFDEGWDYSYYNLDDMHTGLYYGPFSYEVVFEYDGEPMENTDDFDFYEAFKDLKVSSVTFEGLGDAANIE